MWQLLTWRQRFKFIAWVEIPTSFEEDLGIDKPKKLSYNTEKLYSCGFRQTHQRNL